MARKEHEQAFKDAEASLLPQGLTPSDYSNKVNARILAGEISAQRGKDALITDYEALNTGATPVAESMNHEGFGAWAGHPEDGLEYQESAREEWNKRER